MNKMFAMLSTLGLSTPQLTKLQDLVGNEAAELKKAWFNPTSLRSSVWQKALLRSPWRF